MNRFIDVKVECWFCVLLLLIIVLINYLFWKNFFKKDRDISPSNGESHAGLVNQYEVEGGGKLPLLGSKRRSVVLGVLIALIGIGLLIICPLCCGKCDQRLPPDPSEFGCVFGVDVSHYSGKINWSKVRDSHHPIEFVFIRATMGTNGADKVFSNNWRQAKRQNFICGAYHYYRPDEDSDLQFENFKSSVHLVQGDLPPVLDVENLGYKGLTNWRNGILNWLQLAEKEYGVKPIIYTGKDFYKKNLEGHVDDYPLWIAAYSGERYLRGIDWEFHQFSDQVWVDGVSRKIDGNNFKGSLEELKSLCLD